MTGPLVAVDLGGTLIRAAVVTGPAAHAEPVRRPTPSLGGPDVVLEAVAGAVREAAGAALPVAGVAIGIPGPLDPHTGVVYAAPNMRGWRDVPAADLLVARLGCPVAVHNDARLAAYAEWRAGAGSGTRHFLFMTVSTGVGGGLVVDGELHAGAAGTAGEIGHMIADPLGPPCGEGHPGCLEGTASGSAIARRAREALDRGEVSALSTLPAGALDAHAVHTAAEAGDGLARRLYADAGRALGLAVGSLLNVLSPEVVAVGGGLINAGALLFDPLRAAMADIAFPVALQRCRLVPAALGTDAGLVGAAAWAVRSFGVR